MNGSITVVGFDVDYTLVQWKREYGLRAAAPVLQRAIPQLKVSAIVQLMDALSMALLTSDDIELREKITQRVIDSFERHVRANEQYGQPKEVLWSQVSKSSLLCDASNVDPSHHYGTLVAAERAFWDGVGSNSQLYDDAIASVRRLRTNGIGLFALTSSDARVALHPGTSLRRGPHPYYSAPLARDMKMHRFSGSGLFDILPKNDVIVCDPWHKEDVDLWERRVFPKFPVFVDRSRWAYVGDSRYDMVAAHKAGIGRRIFVNRHNIDVPPQATHGVYSLAEAVDIILRAS